METSKWSMEKYLLVSLLPLLCLLSGCGATAEDYKYTPTSVLCGKLMTTPSYNVNRKAREKALHLRGDDCSSVQQKNVIIKQ